jgi:hypothetical protein
VKLDPGWHIYSLTQPPSPASLADRSRTGTIFEQAGDPQQPKPKVAFDPNFQIETATFEGSVTFTLPIKVDLDAPAGAQKVVSKVTFQMCDAERCLPPRTRPIEAEVQILCREGWVAAVASATVTPSPQATTSPKPVGDCYQCEPFADTFSLTSPAIQRR